MPVGAGVDFVFDQISEKALGKILRIFHAVSTAAHETVKRRPIGLAKLCKRGLRNLLIDLAFPRGNHRAPMGFRKEIAPAIPSLGKNLHISGLYQDRRRKASREKK